MASVNFITIKWLWVEKKFEIFPSTEWTLIGQLFKSITFFLSLPIPFIKLNNLFIIFIERKFSQKQKAFGREISNLLHVDVNGRENIHERQERNIADDKFLIFSIRNYFWHANWFVNVEKDSWFYRHRNVQYFSDI